MPALYICDLIMHADICADIVLIIGGHYIWWYICIEMCLTDLILAALKSTPNFNSMPIFLAVSHTYLTRVFNEIVHYIAILPRDLHTPLSSLVQCNPN